MPKELQKISKGEARTLIEAAEANKLIDAINSLRRFEVSPNSFGSVKASDDKNVIDLSPLDDYIKQLVKQAIADATQNTNPNNDGTSNSGGGGGGGGNNGGGPNGTNSGYPPTAQYADITVCDGDTNRTIRVLTA